MIPLYSSHPLLAAQLHPTLNEGINLAKISAGSKKKVWWVGECSHEWEAAVLNRATGNSGCPYCAGKKILVGFNDFKSQASKSLLSEWHPTRNDIKPDEISYKANIKIWWTDSFGHEWQATVNSRVMREAGCPVCKGNAVLVGENDLATLYPHLAAEWHPTKNCENKPYHFRAASNKKVWWIDSQGHEWEAAIDKRSLSKQGCPYCSGNKVLNGFNDLATLYPNLADEMDPVLNVGLLPQDITIGSKQKIVDFLQSKNIQLIQSDRKILSGVELDIYIPDKKIAIEFNGVYWHSELFKLDTMYHHNKWLKCKQQGIQLIQIWEDEWMKNPNQIKSMLLHKLGVANDGAKSIYARQTHVKQVSTREAKSFYDKFHIQGFASASCYYGLEQKGILYAVIALKKEPENVLNIIRYATSHNVVGGFTKLLKHAEKTLDPNAFITFSDHCVSDGGLYENNGFIVDKELLPDYRYVWRGERKHKFGYRLSRFKNDPSLIWHAGMTEKELANLNGLYRIWDAGKTKWKKRIK